MHAIRTHSALTQIGACRVSSLAQQFDQIIRTNPSLRMEACGDQANSIARYVQDERPSIPALTHMHAETDHATPSCLIFPHL